MRARVAPLTKPLTASGLRVPGDKSISHRALLFAALAEGESRIGGLAPGDDVRSTARCLAQLGVPLMRGDGTPWIPKPRSMDFPEDEEPISSVSSSWTIFSTALRAAPSETSDSSIAVIRAPRSGC